MPNATRSPRSELRQPASNHRSPGSKDAPPSTSSRNRRRRRTVARAAFALALVFVGWLPLGIVEVVPFALAWPGESSLRLHAAAAVFFLLVAAWGFWERS